MKELDIRFLEREALKNIKKGKTKKAEKILEQLILLNNCNTRTLNLLGLCKYTYCNFQLAHRIWEVSYNKDGNNKAKKYLEKLRSSQEQRLQKMFKIAVDNIKVKRYEEAAITLNEIIEMNGELIPPKILLASIETNTNKIKKMYRTIEIYKIDETNIEHERLRAQVLEKLLYLTLKCKVKIVVLFIFLLVIIGIIIGFISIL